MSANDLALLMPEIVVLIVALWAYVGGVFTGTSGVWSWIAGGGLAVSAWHLSQQYGVAADASAAGGLLVDHFAFAFRAVALAVGALFVLIFARPAGRRDTGETIGSLL